MRPTTAQDITRCPACGYWSSSFVANGSDARERLVESRRREALESLRRATADQTLDVLKGIRPLEGASLLDIGCAYGWFLEAAQARGMLASGIEPEEGPAHDAIARGLDVRLGFFPDALPPNRRFDLLTFNDVLEHLDAAPRMLDACRDAIEPDGLLAITIPSSEGMLYRAACGLRSVGVCGPFDRLWQKDFPCPHVHYFSPGSLDRLAARHGFELVRGVTFPPFQIEGLWNRLRMDGRSNFAGSATMWLLLTASYPFLRALPSDVMLRVYRVSSRQTPNGSEA